MQKKLLVFLEINGQQTYVGNIVYQNPQEAGFTYAEEYLNSSIAASISINLPLRSESFSTQQTKIYFEGLLPEGFTRRTVAKWMHVNEEDYLSILIGLGNECLGAVRVMEEDGRELPFGYELLEHGQIEELAREGATKSAELLIKSHLSLTGASGKVGLYYNNQTKQWFLPLGEAPSTHIVKQSHVRMDGIVTNEQLCLLTAQRLGIEIPESFIINTGNANEGEVLFATRRYDRAITEESRKIHGLKIPYRLHQEDFAQALGKPASEKYEKSDEGYLAAMFQLLLRYSENPIEDQLKLWDIIVYDYLVGNTDNHIKNLSLLYSSSLKGIHLAPAYDIISTTIYEASTRDMGIAIGNQLNISEINEAAFKEEAEKAKLNVNMAMHRFDHMTSEFEAALSDTALLLEEQGFQKAKSISEKILSSGGYANSK